MASKYEKELHLERLALTGLRSNANEIKKLQTRWKSDSENVELRVPLLGFYYRARLRSEPAIRKHFEQVLWFIDNHPTNFIANAGVFLDLYNCKPKEFAEATEHWKKHIRTNPKNARIIGNAGIFLCQREIDRGIKLLQQAQRLDPSNYLWPEKICFYSYLEYKYKARKNKAKYARSVLGAGEDALRLRPPRDRVMKLIMYRQLGHCALFLGKLEDACRYADLHHSIAKSSQGEDLRQNLLRFRACIYGLVALKNDDLPAAKKRLDFLSTKQFQEWQLALKKQEIPDLSHYGGE